MFRRIFRTFANLTESADLRELANDLRETEVSNNAEATAGLMNYLASYCDEQTDKSARRYAINKRDQLRGKR